MDALLHVGLSNAVAATLLAVPVAVVAWASRRPALAHALWLLVLLKLVTPPLFPVALPWADPLAAVPEPAAPPVPPVPVGPAAPPKTVQAPEPLAVPAQAVAEPAPVPAPRGEAWKPILLAAWLGGALLWWTVACLRVARFRRLLRHAAAAPEELQEQARRLAGRLGLARCPGVWLVPARLSPLLWAVGWSPRLLLPADLWQTLTPEQRDTLLAHELAHLRRRDHWVRRLELLVLGLFWWHPVVWWARRELAEAEEACCDAWVVWALPDAGPAYAAALVATVTFLSQSRRPVPLAASGAGRVKTVKRRLSMILQKPSPRALSGAGLLAVLCLAALLLPLLPTWAEPQAAQDVPKEPRSSPAAPGGKRAGDASPAPAPGKRAGAPAKAPPVVEPPRGFLEDQRLRQRIAVEREFAHKIAQAKDEIELLQAQVAVKRAQLQAAEAALRYAEQSLKRVSRLRASGALSVEEYQKFDADKVAQEAQVAIKQAELREPEVRLAQAVRRLKGLQAQAGLSSKDAPTPPASTNWADALFDRHKLELLLVHGKLGAFQFRVTNTTRDVVRISELRTSSAAVSAVASAKALVPGQESFISVMVDSSKFTGVKTFPIHVAFDKPRRAEVKLQVRVDATTKIVDPDAPAASGGRGAEDRERLRELEKKMDRLLKEMEDLRKKLTPKQSGGKAPAVELGTVRSDSKTMKIPFHLDPSRSPAVVRLRLYCSRDQGRTWEQVGSATPDQGSFTYTAPAAGLYWFRVATEDARQRQEPPPHSGAPPELRVLVGEP